MAAEAALANDGPLLPATEEPESCIYDSSLSTTSWVAPVNAADLRARRPQDPVGPP